jgi:hypothetical protein
MRGATEVAARNELAVQKPIGGFRELLGRDIGILSGLPCCPA